MGANTGAALAAAIRAKKRVIELGAGGICIELLRVEPGSFELGSPLAAEGRHPSEGPIRRVTLTRPFYLGKYPITQGQYTAVTGKVPDRPSGAGCRHRSSLVCGRPRVLR